MKKTSYFWSGQRKQRLRYFEVYYLKTGLGKKFLKMRLNCISCQARWWKWHAVGLFGGGAVDGMVTVDGYIHSIRLHFKSAGR